MNALCSNPLIQSPTEVLPAVLYMSITGNPTHLGHMAAISTAIDILKKKEIRVDEVRVSLSNDDYLKHKVKYSPGDKKIALSQLAREHILNATIQEAQSRKMFNDVKVIYWDDQDQGYSDHPESYQRLAETHRKTHRVYLVAGIDLCMRMNNWSDIEHAIVINREMDSKEKAFGISKSRHDRIFADSLYPEYAKLSSTAIQKGIMKLEPDSLQEYFAKQH